MLYGNIAVFDPTPIFNIALFNALAFKAWDFKTWDFKTVDAGCARPPARAPDTPSSTR
jgi:hypothetical protein